MRKTRRLSIIFCVVASVFICYSTVGIRFVWTLKGLMLSPEGGPAGPLWERTLRYFRGLGQIEGSDAAEVRWCHGVNSRSRLMEALSGKPAAADVSFTVATPWRDYE